MRVVVVVLGVLALNACAPAPSDTAADLKAIDGLRDAYVAAFNAEDADKTAAALRDRRLYMADKAQQVIGRDTIRDRYREIMAGIDCDIQLKAEETVVNGDWAFERGQTWVHIMAKDPKSTLPMIMDQGKYLVDPQEAAGQPLADRRASRAIRISGRRHHRPRRSRNSTSDADYRLRRASRCRLTSGHSLARML